MASPEEPTFSGTDRFSVSRKIGEGGNGVVYEAYDQELEERVALKVLRRLGGDEILHFKNEFRALQGVQHPNLVSLGELIEREWGSRLIRGWNEGWMSAPARVGDKIARLVGARQGEVVLADSTSVNLFKLGWAALEARPGRRKIVTDDLNFPSDLYVLRGLCEQRGQGHQLEIVPSEDGVHGPVEGLLAALDADTALLTLSHTVFKSAYTYALARLTAAAHEAGALVLWDLSHSVGSVVTGLAAAGADLAVGCTYKYLNGGPGAPAFLYLAERHHDAARQPLQGWMGHARPFDFTPGYESAGGIRRFLAGTPGILGMTALDAALDVFDGIAVTDIRKKSLALTAAFIEAVAGLDLPGVAVITPY